MANIVAKQKAIAVRMMWFLPIEIAGRTAGVRRAPRPHWQGRSRLAFGDDPLAERLTTPFWIKPPPDAKPGRHKSRGVSSRDGDWIDNTGRRASRREQRDHSGAYEREDRCACRRDNGAGFAGATV